jgi:hypothetical protein
VDNAQSFAEIAAKHTAALLCGVTALAGIAASEGFSTGDIKENNGPPWSAIGHVNVAGYRTALKCSGVLVKPTGDCQLAGVSWRASKLAPAQ